MTQERPEERCYINRRLAHRLNSFSKYPLEEVVLMGNKPWKVVLRWVISFLITLWIMILVSPKAC